MGPEVEFFPSARAPNEVVHVLVLRSEGRYYQYRLHTVVRPDELSFEMRLEQCTTKGSSSKRVARLLPAFVLAEQNQTNSKYLSKFVHTGNATLLQK